MSISSDDRIAGPFSSGTVLPFDFKVFQASDVRVVKTLADGTVLPDLVAPTDYGVTLNPDQDVDAGGEVTLVTAISGGASVVVTSNIPNTQPTTITNSGGFLPATLNTAFDRQCIQLQQVNTKVKASLQFPVSDANVNSAELPTATIRANKYLAFDANGDVVVNDGPVGGVPPSVFGETFIQAADAPAAKNVLGAGPYVPPTATVGSSIPLPEATNNGTNTASLKAPDSLASNVVSTLPSATGTLANTTNEVHNSPTLNTLIKGTVSPKVCEGRLTLTSGTPVTTGNVTGATAIYFTPYNGVSVALFDGGSWGITTFSELTLNLGTVISGRPYDVFLDWNGGTPVLVQTAWTNDTTRATALTRLNGVLVKSGTTTQRYLGTFYTTSTTTTEDSVANRYLWNYYNRVERGMVRKETATSWTYSTNAFRQLNNASANQLNFVIGVEEDAVSVIMGIISASNSAAVLQDVEVGIGIDSTTVDSSSVSSTLSVFNSYFTHMDAKYYAVPPIGKHFLAALEKGAGSNTQTWRSGGAGLVGIIKC